MLCRAANLFMFGVYNEGSTPVGATMDMNGSVGLNYNCGAPQARMKVEAKGWETLMQCQVAKGAQQARLRTSLKVGGLFS